MMGMVSSAWPSRRAFAVPARCSSRRSRRPSARVRYAASAAPSPRAAAPAGRKTRPSHGLPRRTPPWRPAGSPLLPTTPSPPGSRPATPRCLLFGVQSYPPPVSSHFNSLSRRSARNPRAEQHTISPPLRRGRRRRAASRQEIGPAAVGRGTGTGERSLHATIAEIRRTLPKITGLPADPAAATLDVGRARSLSPARSRARPRQLCPGAASRVARRPHTPGDKEDEG